MEMTRNRQMCINLATAVLAFAVNVGINFVLSPYIVRFVGVEAFGYWGLANNIIGCISIIAVALNSMAARFFTIEVQRGDMAEANRYFCSVLFANAAIVLALAIPSLFFVVRVESFIRIPGHLSADVHALFIMVFSNLFIGMIASAFMMVPFACNRIYLRSMRQAEGFVIKGGLLILLFSLLKPKIYFLGLATMVMCLYETTFAVHYTRSLMPELRVDFRQFDIKRTLDVISAGLWNVLNQAGAFLSTGLDLLLANLFLGPAAMGVLALSKTVPALIGMMLSSIASVFVPEFTTLYARGERDRLILSIRRSIKVLGIAVNIPAAGLIALGPDFFRLWVPSQDPFQLQTLSLASAAAIILCGSCNGFFGLFTAVNRIKPNSILVLLTGILNVAIVLPLLKYTGSGLFAIAGVSSVLILARNFLFTIPFGAVCVNLPWKALYRDVGKTLLGCFLTTSVAILTVNVVPASNWKILAVEAIFFGLAGLWINARLLLLPGEKQWLKNAIFRILRSASK